MPLLMGDAISYATGTDRREVSYVNVCGPGTRALLPILPGGGDRCVL